MKSPSHGPGIGVRYDQIDYEVVGGPRIFFTDKENGPGSASSPFPVEDKGMYNPDVRDFVISLSTLVSPDYVMPTDRGYCVVNGHKISGKIRELRLVHHGTPDKIGDIFIYFADDPRVSFQLFIECQDDKKRFIEEFQMLRALRETPTT